MRRLVHVSRSWPQRLLLRHNRGIEIALLVVALIFSFSLAVWLLYVVPQEALQQADVSVLLMTDTLDELELWIEERQRALEEGVVLPERPVFSE